MPTIKGWFRSGKEPTILIARARLFAITQHYVPQLRSSAACIAPRPCALCELGLPLQQLAAVPVSEPESEVIWLLKLSSTQRAQINSLATRGDSLVGAELWVEPIPDDTTGRLSIRVTGQTRILPAPVANYIAAIGMKAYDRIASEILADPERLW